MRASSVSWLRRGPRRKPLRSAWRRDSSVDADELPEGSVQLALAMALDVGVAAEVRHQLLGGVLIRIECEFGRILLHTFKMTKILIPSDHYMTNI